MAREPQDPTWSAIYQAVRRAVEPYESAVLTETDANKLASDVLAVFEEYVDE